VTIREPVTGQPAIGELEVVADVLSSDGISTVQVSVDGRVVAVLTEPPYRTTVELGLENAAHLVQVVAECPGGSLGRATVSTAAIPLGGDISVSLQQLYVTAQRSGVSALDLLEQDFVVTDEGDRQALVTFERGDIPFTAVLMIDTSASMYGPRIAAARAGVTEFVRGLQPLDQVSLLAFSDRVVGMTPFTNDSELVAEELEGCRPVGGTAIHDHLFMAVKLLEQRQGRRVVVLLSDGIDSLSVLGGEGVLRKVQHSQALMYWIWLAEDDSVEFDNDRLRNIFSTWHTTDEYRHQIKTLRQTVEDSGGRVVRVRSVDRIETVFVDILRELRDQYVLGYYPSGNRDDGSWHRVRVTAKEAGVEVRTHAGYVDF